MPRWIYSPDSPLPSACLGARIGSNHSVIAIRSAQFAVVRPSAFSTPSESARALRQLIIAALLPSVFAPAASSPCREYSLAMQSRDFVELQPYSLPPQSAPELLFLPLGPGIAQG